MTVTMLLGPSARNPLVRQRQATPEFEGLLSISETDASIGGSESRLSVLICISRRPI